MPQSAPLGRCRSPRRAIRFAALLTLALLAAPPPAPGADPADPVALGQGGLTWGVKGSWRSYAGQGQLGDGATQPTPAGPYSFPLSSGAFDPATGATVAEFAGSVHWRSHYYPNESSLYDPPAGYTGPLDIYVLDVRIASPRVEISPDRAVLSAEVVSRSLSTWEIVDHGRIPMVTLSLAGVTPTIADGDTTWPQMIASWTSEAVEPVGYTPGLVVDPVSFWHDGEGGLPVFDESWTAPATIGMELDRSGLLPDDPVATKPVWVDLENEVVHFFAPPEAGSSVRKLRAYDLDTFAPLGAPLEVAGNWVSRINSYAFADPDSSRIYFKSTGLGAAPAVDSYIEWDDADEQYELGSVAGFGAGVSAFVWDPERRRALGTISTGSGASAVRKLNVFTAQPDGTFSTVEHQLPVESGYRTLGAALLADGSLILTRSGAADPLQRVSVVEGVAQVETIPGSAGGYTRVWISDDGSGYFVRPGFVKGSLVEPAALQRFRWTPEEGIELIGPQIEMAEDISEEFAFDRAGGTLWGVSRVGQTLFAFRDGQVVGRLQSPFVHQQYRVVEIGPDGDLVVGGSDGEAGASGPHGIAVFKRTGVSPTVTEDPADATVVDYGSGAEATFSAAASGAPGVEAEWQVKPVGAVRFSPIEGESGAGLTIGVTDADSGQQVRAVFRNAAGSIATEPASIDVQSPPRVTTEPTSARVTEGAGAVFGLLGVGNPEPAVTWQRRVGGFWQPIAPDDDNFAIGASSLTVLDANTDQSGALFRAKLANDVGATFSRSVRLTVVPAIAIPPEGLDVESVSLEWRGNEEMQKAPPVGGSNYFSAGASDGKEAGYRSLDGDAAVLQTSASGAESLASWASRAAHVAGGEQLVRLYGGDARIEPDGSAAVEWEGSFSVNFYGGMVPFTFTDPELVVDADGSGALTARMSGCASSQSNPGECVPLTPVPDVTVSTFSGVEIDPSGEVEVTPDYAGVEVEVPSPFAPQHRAGPGWGAWPQSFVDFQVQTGLSAYWYTSNGAFDPYKPPLPFVVDFDGGAPPAGASPAGPGSEAERQPVSRSQGGTVAIVSAKGARRIGGRGVVRIATLLCPWEGRCRVSAPRRVRVRVGAVRYRAAVIAPRRIEPGGRAALRLRLPRPALRALTGRGRAAVAVLALRSGDGLRSVRVVLRHAGGNRIGVLATPR